jgi:phosphatidylinositol dimannoside acyltransferase
MNLQAAVSSPGILRLGMFLGRHTPPRVGHGFARLAAGLVCRTKPAVYHILTANLRQVLGPDAGETVVRRTTCQAFYLAVRSYYDLYHTLARSTVAVGDSIDLPESTQATLHEIEHAGKGTVVVLPHLGNFDLVGQALAMHVSGFLAISLPNPPPGFELTNELRRQGGIEVIPLSAAALRQAIARLRQGGIVAFGGDRPVSALDEPVPFFGRPARLPSGAVRLALKTGARIVVAYCVMDIQAGKNTLYLEPPLEMIHTGSREEEVAVNMGRVVHAFEQAIRRWPEQWLMFVPVWPEQ